MEPFKVKLLLLFGFMDDLRMSKGRLFAVRTLAFLKLLLETLD